MTDDNETGIDAIAEKFYTVSPDKKSIKCHRCGRVSYNLMDVAHTYCANCCMFLDIRKFPKREQFVAEYRKNRRRKFWLRVWDVLFLRK